VHFLLHCDKNVNILHSGVAGCRSGANLPPLRIPSSGQIFDPIQLSDETDEMPKAILTIASKNYGSWSLRGWLLCKMAGLDFDEQHAGTDDPSTRAELLLLSPSFLVPCLHHDGLKVWDTLAIADYLHELSPQAGLLPADRAQRAHCRAICGEMHSGFSNLRSALPMNIKAHFPGFKAWAGARGDIDRITAIWRECLDKYGGPYLFGSKPCAADAMYAPVCARFLTYDVALEPHAAKYCRSIMALPLMQEWIAGAKAEPDELEELDVEF
jgi:glutathione S-transferase